MLNAPGKLDIFSLGNVASIYSNACKNQSPTAFMEGHLIRSLDTGQPLGSKRSLSPQQATTWQWCVCSVEDAQWNLGNYGRRGMKGGTPFTASKGWGCLRLSQIWRYDEQARCFKSRVLDTWRDAHLMPKSSPGWWEKYNKEINDGGFIPPNAQIFVFLMLPD